MHQAPEPQCDPPPPRDGQTHDPLTGQCPAGRGKGTLASREPLRLSLPVLVNQGVTSCGGGKGQEPEDSHWSTIRQEHSLPGPDTCRGVRHPTATSIPTLELPSDFQRPEA